MKNYVLIIVLTFLTNIISAQKHDQIWLTGHSNQMVDTTFGGTLIDFSFEPPELTYQFREMNFAECSASICDKEGNLLFYTNCTWIANADHVEMLNGDSLGINPFHHSWIESGLPLSQYSLILPYPNSDQLFILLHEEIAIGGVQGYEVPNCYYSIIDMSGDGGLGEVILKNQVIVNDTLDFGKVTATKHANGRDWWVLVPEFSSNQFHTLLIDPLGVHLEFDQTVGDTAISGVGQAVFSPDGKKYVRYNACCFTEPASLDIYDFDRCNGMLSNPQRIVIDTINGEVDYGGGVAISSNSKFLYFSYWDIVVQYDLKETDIYTSADTVAVYDGFLLPSSTFYTRFNLAHLASDEKIYINTSLTTPYLHIIHNPNEKGIACNVEQHTLELPTYNNRTIPNFPNFRLYAEIGSSCDSLRPIAQFTSQSNALTVAFLDESQRTPTEWLWTFGDGANTEVQHPEHQYANSGMYEVCLVVSNEAGSDTSCQTIDIILDNIEEQDLAEYIKISPNPTNGNIMLELPSNKTEDWHIRIYDTFGRELLEKALPRNIQNQKISISHFSTGVYFYKITNESHTVKSGKIVKE